MTVHLNSFKVIRMEPGGDAVPDQLEQDADTGDFESAARGSGTGAAEHQDQHYGLCKSWPDAVIGAGESGGGQEGRRGERRIPQGVANGRPDGGRNPAIQKPAAYRGSVYPGRQGILCAAPVRG